MADNNQGDNQPAGPGQAGRDDAGKVPFDPVGDEKWGQTTMKELFLLLCEKLDDPAYETEESGYVKLALNTDLKNGVRLSRKRVPAVVWRILSYLSLPGVYIHPAVELEQTKRTAKEHTVEIEDEETRWALINAFYGVAAPGAQQMIRRPGNDQIRHMFIPFFTSNASAFVHFRFNLGAEGNEWDQRCLIHVNLPDNTTKKDDDMVTKIGSWLGNSRWVGFPETFPPHSELVNAAPSQNAEQLEQGKKKDARRNLRLLYGLSYLRDTVFGPKTGFGKPGDDLFSASVNGAPPAAFEQRVRDCNSLVEAAARAFCESEGKDGTIRTTKGTDTVAMEELIAASTKESMKGLKWPANAETPEELQGDGDAAQQCVDGLIDLANTLVCESVVDPQSGNLKDNHLDAQDTETMHIALPYIMYPAGAAVYIHTAVDLDDKDGLKSTQEVLGGQKVARLIQHALTTAQNGDDSGTDQPTLQYILIPVYQTLHSKSLGKDIRHFSLFRYRISDRNLAVHRLGKFPKEPVKAFQEHFRLACMPDYKFKQMDGKEPKDWTFDADYSDPDGTFVQDHHPYSLCHVVLAIYLLVRNGFDDQAMFDQLGDMGWDEDLCVRAVQVIYASLLHVLTRGRKVVSSGGTELISWLHGGDDKTQRTNPKHRAVFAEVMNEINDWHMKQSGVTLRPEEEDGGDGMDTGGQDAGGQDTGGQDTGGQDTDDQDVGGDDTPMQDINSQEIQDMLGVLQTILDYFPARAEALQATLAEEEERLEVDDMELDLEDELPEGEISVMDYARRMQARAAAGVSTPSELLATPQPTAAGEEDAAQDLADVASQLIQCLVEVAVGQTTANTEVVESVRNWLEEHTTEGWMPPAAPDAKPTLRLVFDPAAQRVLMSVDGGRQVAVAAKAGSGGGDDDVMDVDLPIKVRASAVSPAPATSGSPGPTSRAGSGTPAPATPARPRGDPAATPRTGSGGGAKSRDSLFGTSPPSGDSAIHSFASFDDDVEIFNSP